MNPGRTHEVDQPSASRVSRRAALQVLATGVGVTVASPLAAAEAIDHLHPAAETAREQAASTSSSRAFLSDHQFGTLEILAALILPGAEASGTPAFLDKMLAVDAVDARRRFVSALGAFDGAAMGAHQRAFKDITRAQQAAILTQASTMAPGRTAPGAEPSNLRDYFEHLKGLVAEIHFSSEAGLRELGWTGNVFFERFNGCATQP